MAFTPTGVEFISKGFSGYLKNLKTADKAQQRLGQSASGIGKSFSGLGKNVLSFGASLAKVAAGGVLALGAGLAAAGGIAISTAISFESAFAGVEKTVDGLDKTIAGTSVTLGEKLKGSLVDLTKVIPTTFEELARIGELGGQLGIQYSETDDSLLKFTETIAALGETTNLTEEVAATSLARISNIFQKTGEEAGENIERLGSTIVALGNNFATSESEIVNFATRIAGAGQVAGLTQDQILAIGAAFSSVGVGAERGGTAVQKVLLAMNGAVNATSDGFVDNSKKIDQNVKRLTKLQAESARLEAQAPGLQDAILKERDAFIAAGGSAEEFGRQLGDKTRQKAFETATAINELTTETQLLRDQQGQPIDPGQLQKFADVAGVSADEFAQAWEDDAAGAFELFVKGLGREGDNAESVLRDLDLTDQRLIASFLSLAGAGDLLSDTLELGSEAWEENTALTKEAEKRYATTESQILLLKNSFRAIADSIGSRFLPIVNQVITTAKDLVEKWAGPIEDAIENIVIPAIEKVTGAFERFGVRGATISILGLLGLDPGQIAGVLGVADQIVGVIDKIAGAFERFGVRGAAISILGLLGLEPGEIANVLGVFDGIQQVISDFASGGIIAALGGGGGGGGVSVILSALGLSESTIADVEAFLLRIKTAIFGFIVSISFGGSTGQGAAAFLSAFGLDESVLTTVQTTIDGIIAIVQQLPTSIGQAITFIQENIESFKGALLGIGAVILGGAVLGAIAAIGSVILALLTPINIIIAVAALLGAAWFGNWFGIQEITMSVIQTLTNLFNTAFPIIQAVVLTAGAVISSVFAGIMAVIVGQVVPNLQAAFDNITMALASLGISWSDVWNAIATAVGIVAAVIGAILLVLVAVITSSIAAASAVILTFSEAFNQVQQAISQVLLGIEQLVIGFVQFWSAVFAGDLTGAVEAWKLQMSGLGNFLGGIFQVVLTAITTPLAVLLTFLSEFVISIITFFTELSNTLVGNSIIPDMVQAIIDTFTGLIEPILSVFSTLSEGIGSILGAIFGGGEEEAPSFAFNPEEALLGLEQVQLAIDTITLGITNLSILTLPTLTTAIMTMVATTILLWQQVILTIMKLNLLVVELYSIHLPTLQAITLVTTQAMIDGFTLVNTTVMLTTSLIIQLTTEIQRLGDVAKRVIDKMIEAFEALGKAIDDVIEKIKDVADAINEDLVEALENAAEAANSLKDALEDALNAAQGLGGALASQGLGFNRGVGFKAGVGFQGGTLGFTVPQGFPNDSFLIGLTSTEEVLVAPPSSSIDEIVMDAFGVGGQSVMVDINIGSINNPMDLATNLEIIKRTVAEAVN